MANVPTPPAPGADKPGGGKLLIGGIAVIGLVLYLFNAGNQTEYEAQEQGSYAPVAAAAPQAQPVSTPSAPAALDRRAVARAVTHLRLATREEGVGGARVYSQNCFAALKAGFSWARLDVCGAFDVAASAYAGDQAAIGSSDESYFQSETAAGRYLALAVEQGLPAADADQRLAEMQSLVAARSRSASQAAVEEPSPPPAATSLADEAENVFDVEPTEPDTTAAPADENEIVDGL